MEVSTLLLGAIAVSTVVMATVQVGIIVFGARLAQRVNRLIDQVEKEIQPALTQVNEASGHMTQAASLAVAQLERADQLCARFTDRVDSFVTVGQDAVVEPVRHCIALIRGLRAALETLRRASHATPVEPETEADDERQASEEQEALFIG
jgi:hypothetical protein